MTQPESATAADGFRYPSADIYGFTPAPTQPAASTEIDILVSRVERQITAEVADTPLERALSALAARAGFTVTA